MKTPCWIPLAAAAVAALPAAGQTLEWLPKEVQERAAHDLSQRLNKTGFFEGKSDEEVLQGARRMVGGIQKRLDELGPTGVFEATTPLPSFPMPEMRDPALTALARLGFCKFPLDIIIADESAEADQRLAATLSAFWSEMTFAFLRAHYFANGGAEEEIKAALTLDPLNQNLRQGADGSESGPDGGQRMQPDLRKPDALRRTAAGPVAAPVDR